MKLNTSRFGEVEVDDKLVFDFIEPILGYDRLKKFVLVDNTPDSPFKWLQSAEDPNVAFPVTFPAYFGINYQFTLPDEKAERLSVTSADNVLSFNIVCIPQGNPQESTVNLLGPIVINIENKKGIQLVLTDTKYTVKHRLFEKDTAKCSS